MLSKRFSLLIILAFSFFSIGQESAIKICNEKLIELNTTEQGNWSRLNDTTLTWVHSDTFRIINRISAIRGAAQLDSLTITLRFADGWNKDRIETTKKNNAAIIEPLSTKFLAALDSMEWEGIKLNRQMFLANKVLYLPLLRSITKFTAADMELYNSIERIPDYLYNNVGIYLDSRPNYAFQYIDDIKVDNIMFDQLKHISKTLDSEKTKIGIKMY